MVTTAKQSNLAKAEAYYSAVVSGDYDKMGSYLHSDVLYNDQNWPVTGKDNVWPVARKFGAAIDLLEPAAIFSDDDQVMLVHDIHWKEAEKPMRTAVLLTFDEGLIKQIDFIGDPSQHMDVCRGIFS
jgi:ketosteroid isomerase-like protein